MEYSGRGREAFRKKGHDAWSICDCPAEDGSPYHIEGNVLDHLDDGWDFAVFHPNCTRMTLSGVQWLYHPEDTHLAPVDRRRHPRYPLRMLELLDDVTVFKALQECSIPKKVIENSQPHGLAMGLVGRYTQKVQPWQHGEPFTKGACLWLYGVPPLQPSNIVEGREAACHNASPGIDRWKERSRSYQGIMNAFAESWG